MASHHSGRFYGKTGLFERLFFGNRTKIIAMAAIAFFLTFVVVKIQ